MMRLFIAIALALTLSVTNRVLLAQEPATVDTPRAESASDAANVSDEDPGSETLSIDEEPTTFVIVHGAWGGGWAFKQVDRLLSARGHIVYRPTLTGQGEKVHLASPDIDLNMHIQDVVNAIVWEELDNVILVGHSYGGMVVTGAADRVAERIQRLVYLDAFVPSDGESLNSGREGPRTDGDFVPARWVPEDAKPPHDVPHPAKTLSQPVKLTNPALQELPTTYILTVDEGSEPEEDMFHRFYGRAKERNWSTVVMTGDHNVQWSKPKELVDLLEEIAME